jgi:hypothetical protein
VYPLGGEAEAMSTQPKPIEFPQRYVTKTMPCGKCGREMQVSERTVLAFCRDCSATMGVKK